MNTPRTLYAKLWDAHVVSALPDGEALLYIDRHLVHEVSSPQAFAALREAGRVLRRPETHLAVADHAVPTRAAAPGADPADGPRPCDDPLARSQIAELEANAAQFAMPYAGLDGPEQGIVHVIGPETGLTLPGTTIVCGDSHTTTHGAFGALAFGIGASEQATVMATQCLRQKMARTMRVTLTGALPPGVSAKDVALAFVAMVGSDGATGHAVEFAGPAVTAMSMAARMTLCNMAIEAGSRVGLVAPDETTFAFVRGRRMAPAEAEFDRAVAYWRTLASDADAVFDREVTLDLSALVPHVSWGTSPGQTLPVGAALPDPACLGDVDGALPAAAREATRALAYMGLAAGAPIAGTPITHAFIGSCTNGRIEDLREAAAVLAGRRVDPGVTAIVVPGSAATRLAAEEEGLDNIFVSAGFEWRLPGCSMCVAMNDDRLEPGDRCASTSNRNFEGRQGPGGRTHLMSPAMVAAAAVTGRIVDARELLP